MKPDLDIKRLLEAYEDGEALVRENSQNISAWYWEHKGPLPFAKTRYAGEPEERMRRVLTKMFLYGFMDTFEELDLRVVIFERNAA